MLLHHKLSILRTHILDRSLPFYKLFQDLIGFLRLLQMQPMPAIYLLNFEVRNEWPHLRRQIDGGSDEVRRRDEQGWVRQSMSSRGNFWIEC